MSRSHSSDKSRLLTDMPNFIYGTTRLGDDKIPFEDRVRLARSAMEAVRWFPKSAPQWERLAAWKTSRNFL